MGIRAELQAVLRERVFARMAWDKYGHVERFASRSKICRKVPFGGNVAAGSLFLVGVRVWLGSLGRAKIGQRWEPTRDGNG